MCCSLLPISLSLSLSVFLFLSVSLYLFLSRSLSISLSLTGTLEKRSLGEMPLLYLSPISKSFTVYWSRPPRSAVTNVGRATWGEQAVGAILTFQSTSTFFRRWADTDQSWYAMGCWVSDAEETNTICDLSSALWCHHIGISCPVHVQGHFVSLISLNWAESLNYPLGLWANRETYMTGYLVREPAMTARAHANLGNIVFYLLWITIFHIVDKLYHSSARTFEHYGGKKQICFIQIQM